MKKSRPTSRFNLPTVRIVNTRRSQKMAQATVWREQLLPNPTSLTLSRSQSRRWLTTLIYTLIVALGLVFSFRLYHLQVSAHERYEALASGNRVRENVSFAPRGRILDRDGRVLAQNDLTFRLSVTPYLLSQDRKEREAGYELIGQLTSWSVKDIRSVAEAAGLDYPLPRPIERNLKHRDALALQANLDKLKGWNISELPIRRYRSDAALAHVIGYTGTVSASELAERQQSGLLPIDIIGKTGAEAAFDDILRGQNGFARTEVDTFGRPLRILAQQEAVAGRDIYLTIDMDVQRRLASELRTQMKAARVSRASAVALDPKSGEVLALVSWPSFDNNLFAQGISQRDFLRLVKDPDQPLTNKVIAGGYTTGSTIKPLVAAAALQERVVTPQTIIVDSGAIAVTSQYQPGQAFIFRGWRPGGLGPMNVRSALAWSSNIYFYTVGGGHGNISGLGEERLTSYYRQFGLGETTGIELPGEITGRVADAAWKRQHFGQDWFVGDTYNISIGQGDMLVTPLQLAVANAAIANGGNLLRPRLLYRVGEDIISQPSLKRKLDISSTNLQIVRDGLRQVVTSGTTCECVFKDVPVKVAGKTGTAQTTSDESRRPHAWFVAYAPFDNPKFLGTAMLEEGSGGSQYAAPAIASGMAAYFR